jgi:hypothetical protein
MSLYYRPLEIVIATPDGNKHEALFIRQDDYDHSDEGLEWELQVSASLLGQTWPDEIDEDNPHDMAIVSEWIVTAIVESESTGEPGLIPGMSFSITNPEDMGKYAPIETYVFGNMHDLAAVMKDDSEVYHCDVLVVQDPFIANMIRKHHPRLPNIVKNIDDIHMTDELFEKTSHHAALALFDAARIDTVRQRTLPFDITPSELAEEILQNMPYLPESSRRQIEILSNEHHDAAKFSSRVHNSLPKDSMDHLLSLEQVPQSLAASQKRSVDPDWVLKNLPFAPANATLHESDVKISLDSGKVDGRAFYATWKEPLGDEKESLLGVVVSNGGKDSVQLYTGEHLKHFIDVPSNHGPESTPESPSSPKR